MALVMYSKDHHTAFITLSSPGTGNVVNRENLHLITHYAGIANRDKDIRAIVLQGKDGVFCRGMDFNTVFMSRLEDKFTIPYKEAVLTLRNSSKPVICIVDGEVLAGGMGLVCASDIVLCTGISLFGLSEIYFGLIPAYVFPLLLERVPFKKARYLALSCRKISPEEAYTIGLVDEIIHRDSLKQRLKEYLQRILFSSPGAMGLVKTYSDQLLPGDLDKSLDHAQKQLESLLRDKENISAIKAFQNGEALPWSLSYRKSR